MADPENPLRNYVRTGSETAFRALVEQHIDLVYSTARRLAGGDTHLAEDITQTVFADLARKAHRVSAEAVIGGWLHRHTFFVASTFLRSERRRRQREQEALAMNQPEPSPGMDWDRLAPVLDAALNELPAADRNALVLRYLQNRDLRAVGAALDISDDAAQKRVSRAIERLRHHLVRRGVTLSAAALASCLLTQAVSTAPAALTASVATSALASAAATTSFTFGLFNAMTLTKVKISIVGALALAGVTTPLVLQYRELHGLRAQHQQLLRQHQEAHEESMRLRSNLEKVTANETQARKEHPELIRLRGEVSDLRRQLREIATAPPPVSPPPARVRASAPSADRGTPSAAADFVPAEAWADVGFATPEAAVETLQWAMRTGNDARLREALLVPPGTIPPDAQPVGVGMIVDTTTSTGGTLVSTGTGAPPPDATSVALADISGTRIVSRSDLSADEVSLTVENRHADGTTLQMPMNFKRVEGEWKLAPTFIETPASAPPPSADPGG